MQFSVTFSGPVIVDAKDLADLLGKAHGLCEVEALKDVVDKEFISKEHPPENVVAPSKPRGRPAKKEEPVAETVGVSQGEAQARASEAQAKQESVKAEPDGDLLSRFTALVDKNYDSALQLLENFGVDRFSNLKVEQVEGFSKALEELGV